MGNDKMRNEYDFSASRPNPYAKKLKKQITIRIDESSIDYFKRQAIEVGIPYQSLINLYLADCAENHKELTASWS
jgi:predicted DNA binding CopG/RHH family protein